VLPVVADMVDARGWDPGVMRRKVSEFLALRVQPNAMTRRAEGQPQRRKD